MKTIQKITIVSFILSILISGSSFGVTAINNASDRTTKSVSPSTYFADETFSADIWFVGYGSTEGQRISLDTDGTYHYVDADAASGFNLVRIKTNISGYTCYGDCSDSSLATGNRSLFDATGGAAYVIVDGAVLPAGNGFMSSSGADIALSGIGNHIVTFLYMGKDQDDGVVYGMDTITIRIATADVFPALNSATTDVNVDVTDLAAVSEFNGSATAYYDAGWSSWTKEDRIDPSVSFTLQDATGTTDLGTVVGSLSASTTTLTISGTVNSTGFDGMQIDRVHNSTIGNTFFYDAAGLTPLADLTEVTFWDNTFVTTCDTTVFTPTYLGLITFADNGRWVKDAVSYPSWQAPFADFEGLNTITNSTNSTQTFSLDASFDFTDSFDNQVFLMSSDTPPAACSTITTTTTDTNTVTDTVNTTDVSTKTESPGFGVIVSLLTIGVIAFVAPRIRRVKK
jgi:hypothetical protein